MATATGEGDRNTPYQIASAADLEAALRFVRQLQVKLRAGLSVEKCLAALASDTRNRRMRAACVAMHQTATAGGSLSRAMQAQGSLFDVCVLGLVERGEQARRLRAALDGVADYLEHKGRLEGALRSAVARPLDVLAYVLLAIFIAAVILSFLVKEVLPAHIVEHHATVSAADGIALGVSEAVRVAWPYVGVFGFACFLALRLLPRIPSTRAGLHALALRLPLVSSGSRSTAIAVFSRTIGVCMQAGFTLAQAMEVAVATAANLTIRRRIATTVRKIEKGKPYIDALVEDGLLRLGDVTAIQSAERRGELGAVMLTITGEREREAVAEVKTLKTIAHGLVVVLLGIAIAGVMVTLYVPVFVAR